MGKDEGRKIPTNKDDDKLEEIEVQAENESIAYSIAQDMTEMESDPSDAMWFDCNMEEVVEV